MPPVRCSGKTPAATSGFSQPADGRTDTSSGKSAVFSPRFSPFAAMPPATIVQPYGDPVTLRDDARPFPSHRQSADETVSPPFLSKNADERSDRRQDSSSPFWHLSFHMFYTTIFFVVFLIGTKNEKTHHRVSRPAVVCLFPPSPPSWRRPGRQWRHAQSGRPRTGSRRRIPLKPELAPDPPYPLKQDTGGGIPVPLERVTTVTTYRTCNHDRIADTFQKTIAPSPDNRL